MAAALKVEFHNIQPQEAIEFRIHRELAKLEKFYDRFVSCRVDVEAPEHQRRGSMFKVHVDFGLHPQDATLGAKLGAATFRQGAEHMEVNAQRKDGAMAVHAAFNAVRRRLKDFVNVPAKG
jgi:ribosome-associated translation inhibitor RaiA